MLVIYLWKALPNKDKICLFLIYITNMLLHTLAFVNIQMWMACVISWIIQRSNVCSYRWNLLFPSQERWLSVLLELEESSQAILSLLVLQQVIIVITSDYFLLTSNYQDPVLGGLQTSRHISWISKHKLLYLNECLAMGLLSKLLSCRELNIFNVFEFCTYSIRKLHSF